MLFCCGIAKQLSLSRTIARMSAGFSLPFFAANAVLRGMGSWSKVEIVWCGRQRDGLMKSRRKLKVPDRFPGIMSMMERRRDDDDDDAAG